MLFLNKRTNIISNSLRTILPIYHSEVAKKKTIIVTNYVIDKRFFVELFNIYGLYLLRFNYGVNRYLSELFIFTGGMHKRTSYYFFSDLFHLTYITYLFSFINKRAYEFSYSNVQKKYAQHSFWSISYLHKFPCRGQRRRSNASTAKKLNFAHKLVSSVTLNSNSSTVYSNKRKVKQSQKNKK
jgi:hypothetical protein